MRHAYYARNFEWVLRDLADSGHTIHIGVELYRPAPDVPAARLAEEYEGITFGDVPVRRDLWCELVFDLRQAISYLRYLAPRYRDAGKLRNRWARHSPPWIVQVTEKPLLRSPTGRRALDFLLRRCEASIPRDPEIDAYLRNGGFDVVMVTPLVDGPSQVDWLRSAKALGIPAVLATASWDNLTLKGLALERPDRTYVWNEIQRREALEHHRIPLDTVVATGAHTFDHWFGWHPTSSREEFCDELGLDPSKPIVLYVGSSGLISKDERPVVRSWLEAVRRSPRLRDIGVLVRPHVNGSVWANNPFAGVDNTAVWPPVGALPMDSESRADFFDSVFHSSAVVGINTTALIEAAILGRPTLSVLLQDVRGGQSDTLHFHYLRDVNGGAVAVAPSLEEHVRDLETALADGDAFEQRRRQFVEAFVRPKGVDTAAAPRLTSDLAKFVASFQPAARRRPAWPTAVTAAVLRRALPRYEALKVETRRHASPRSSV
jgi:hypothetical protein